MAVHILTLIQVKHTVLNMADIFDQYLQLNKPAQTESSSDSTYDNFLSLNNSPADVSTAKTYVDNPEMNQHAGMCQQFVEQVTQGKTGIYPSAIDAWQQQQNRARAGLDGAKPGDAVYFAPDSSNGYSGHTGILTKDGKFISATDNGVKEMSIQDWQNMTNQQVMGYLPEGRN